MRAFAIKGPMVAVAVCFLLLPWGCIDEQSKVRIGEEGLLVGTTGTITPVAISENALDEWIKAGIANDNMGKMRLMMTGSIFTVQNGTRVLYLPQILDSPLRWTTSPLCE